MTLPGYAFRVGSVRVACYPPSRATVSTAKTKITTAKTPTTVNIIRLLTPIFSATWPLANSCLTH